MNGKGVRVLVAAGIVSACATSTRRPTTPASRPTFQPTASQFAPRPGPARQSHDPERVLFEQGFAQLGRIALRKPMRRCTYERLGQSCTTLHTDAELREEVLRHAGQRGGDLVVFAKDQIEEIEPLYTTVCTATKVVTYPGGNSCVWSYIGDQSVATCRQTYVEMLVCASTREIRSGYEVSVVSEGIVWRREPELAAAQWQTTRLVTAASTGDLEGVRGLLAEGADPNIPVPSGALPLGLASGGGHRRVAKALLDGGADLRGGDSVHGSALCWAARFGQASMVEFLVARGADPGARISTVAAPDTGKTALFDAAAFGNPTLVERFLELGADPNATTDSGVSVLMAAARAGNPGAVSALLHAGARVTGASEPIVVKKSEMRLTAMVAAAVSESRETVAEILRARAQDDPAAARDEARRASWAASAGTGAQWLLKRFADGVVTYVGPDGVPAFPAYFDDGEAYSEGLAAIAFDGALGRHWGFIDRSGSLVALPTYDHVQAFSGGRARVEVDENAYAFIDESGRRISDEVYTDARAFSDGRARVESRSRPGYRYIGPDGREVIDASKYGYAGEFSDGLACVLSGEKWGYIDTNGKLAIAPQFDSCGSFSSGLAPVGFKNPIAWNRFYIDESGSRVIAGYDEIEPFSEGLAAVNAASFGNSWGYIDPTGRVAISPRFDEAKPFRRGYAKVRLGDEWFEIDTNGRRLERQEEKPLLFVDGLAMKRVAGIELLDLLGREQAALARPTRAQRKRLSVAERHLAASYRAVDADDLIGAYAEAHAALDSALKAIPMQAPALARFYRGLASATMLLAFDEGTSAAARSRLLRDGIQAAVLAYQVLLRDRGPLAAEVRELESVIVKLGGSRAMRRNR